MKQTKMEKDYQELFGDIPKDFLPIIDYIFKDVKCKKVKHSLQDEVTRIMNIKYKTIKFTIYLLPKGCPRPKAGKFHTFYVKGAKDNKKVFDEFIATIDQEVIKTATIFDCIYYMPTPTSLNTVQRVLAEMGLIANLSKPDWDNAGKTYSDMIVPKLLKDDALIIDGRSRKKYSIKPRIEITIQYQEDFDCEYNRKKVMGWK